MAQKKIIIIGAAGRDFHNFNTTYREDPSCKVEAFTAAQIPDIAGRKYPAALAGSLYPEGIPIYPQEELENLIKDLDADECVFSYSDLPYNAVMSLSARVNAAGAAFTLLGHKNTMLKSTKPVIAIGASRTGCGKSQTSCRVMEILMKQGLKVIAIRHPMPYGDLEAQKVQRFAALEDLQKHKCTIEEMEEYEPHIIRGNVIYAGVDYEAILRAAENDPSGCDVILWDGGNNDFPFYKPDLMITVVDPHRAGHELSYYPGEVTLRIADAVVINKIDSADFNDILVAPKQHRKSQPQSGRSRRRLHHQRGEAGDHPRQTGVGHRRRPHPHPRRDEDRCRYCRGQTLRRGGDHRPEALRCGQTGRNIQNLSKHRQSVARHGLRRGADTRPERNH